MSYPDSILSPSRSRTWLRKITLCISMTTKYTPPLLYKNVSSCCSLFFDTHTLLKHMQTLINTLLYFDLMAGHILLDAYMNVEEVLVGIMEGSDEGFG
jgi:hypothetical protein